MSIESKLRVRRVFTAEFTREAVQLIRKDGQSVAEAARRLDVRETLMRCWWKELGATKASVACQPMALEVEVRGVQYASEYYQRLLPRHGITVSMTRKGNCWVVTEAAEPWRGGRPMGGSVSHAPMESFFATLKKELVDYEEYPTRTAARHSLFEYIEVF